MKQIVFGTNFYLISISRVLHSVNGYLWVSIGNAMYFLSKEQGFLCSVLVQLYAPNSNTKIITHLNDLGLN